MDSSTQSLEEYDIPATGIIQIEEKNLTVTVVLPTGNEKLFNISKAKTVFDLKERIAVCLAFCCFLVVPIHCISEPGSSQRRNGAIGHDGADGAGRRESAAVFHRGGFTGVVRSRFR